MEESTNQQKRGRHLQTNQARKGENLKVHPRLFYCYASKYQQYLILLVVFITLFDLYYVRQIYYLDNLESSVIKENSFATPRVKCYTKNMVQKLTKETMHNVEGNLCMTNCQ